MSKLLRDALRSRDPRLTDWTSVLEWIEQVGPGRIGNVLPSDLRDSPARQVYVGVNEREWENDTGAGMSYKGRVVVRIGAIVIYRDCQTSSAAYESGSSRRFEHTDESVYVAVPSDAQVIDLRHHEGDRDYFELRTSALTEVTDKDGPWWDLLLQELRPYLNEKRKFEAAAAAEREKARVAIEERKAEQLRLAAEAVSAPRPLPRPASVPTAAANPSRERRAPSTTRVWLVTIGTALVVIALVVALAGI